MRYGNSKRMGLVFVLLAFFSATGHTQEQNPLKALLVDLPGWKAQKPDSISSVMGAIKIVNATRDYASGEKRITAMVMVGSNAMAYGQIQALTAESNNAMVNLSQIDGFQVHTSFDKAKSSGSIIIFLSETQMQGAVFTISFDGLSDEEALSLAKKFDWNKMKAAAVRLF